MESNISSLRGEIMDKPKIVRDLVYGFITLSEQERAIIDHLAFQRLRRIKKVRDDNG
jgi:hypothetical protein